MIINTENFTALVALSTSPLALMPSFTARQFYDVMDDNRRSQLDKFRDMGVIKVAEKEVFSLVLDDSWGSRTYNEPIEGLSYEVFMALPEAVRDRLDVKVEQRVRYHYEVDRKEVGNILRNMQTELMKCVQEVNTLLAKAVV